MHSFILSFFMLLFMSSACLAQSPKGWLIYFGNTQLGDSKFALHHELQLRDHQFIGDHNQTLLRFGLQYNMSKKVALTAGYAYVHNEKMGSPNEPFSENRIYQEALIKHQISILQLRHRFRLEERFVENRQFSGRARYSLFLDIPLTPKKMAAGGVYAALYNELFINAIYGGEQLIGVPSSPSDTGFDRNRLYSGVGYKLRDNLGVQIGYMRQNVKGQSGTNQVLLSLHHNFKLGATQD